MLNNRDAWVYFCQKWHGIVGVIVHLNETIAVLESAVGSIEFILFQLSGFSSKWDNWKTKETVLCYKNCNI